MKSSACSVIPKFNNPFNTSFSAASVGIYSAPARSRSKPNVHFSVTREGTGPPFEAADKILFLLELIFSFATCFFLFLFF